MIDEFKTVAAESHAELKVQGSRFRATALSIHTKEEAEEFLVRMRKEFWDATHNCYAWRLGADGGQFRANDDGEPSGSAGKPILAAIDAFGVTEVIVVVTRYYGGTKLGVGGLARAYGEASRRALAEADLTTRFITEKLEVTFPHAHVSNVMHSLSRIGAKIVDTQYDEDVRVQFEVRRSKANELKHALVNQTRGNVRVKLLGKHTE